MFPKFLRFFKRIQSSMKEDWIITARRNYANRVLARKIDSGNSKRLSSSQVAWHVYLPRIFGCLLLQVALWEQVQVLQYPTRQVL